MGLTKLKFLFRKQLPESIFSGKHWLWAESWDQRGFSQSRACQGTQNEDKQLGGESPGTPSSTLDQTRPRLKKELRY